MTVLFGSNHNLDEWRVVTAFTTSVVGSSSWHVIPRTSSRPCRRQGTMLCSRVSPFWQRSRGTKGAIWRLLLASFACVLAKTTLTMVLPLWRARREQNGWRRVRRKRPQTRRRPAWRPRWLTEWRARSGQIDRAADAGREGAFSTARRTWCVERCRSDRGSKSVGPCRRRWVLGPALVGRRRRILSVETNSREESWILLFSKRHMDLVRQLES